jgi:hypothetical protein
MSGVNVKRTCTSPKFLIWIAKNVPNAAERCNVNGSSTTPGHGTRAREGPKAATKFGARADPWGSAAEGVRQSARQTDLTSPPSIRKVEPVIHRAPGDTKKAMSSAISSGSP